ncbi:MAG: AI-2E family transporter [Acetobacteraceae bacterium]
MAAPPLLTDRAPARMRLAEPAGLAGLQGLAIAVVVVAGLYLGREVLVPITLAVLLAFLLAPFANLLERAHLGRVPSAIVAVVLAIGLILAIGGLIGTQIAGLAGDVPRYRTTIEHKIDALRGMTVGRLQKVTRALNQQVSRTAEPPKQAATSSKPAATPMPAAKPPSPKPIPVQVQQPSPTPLKLAQRVLAPVVNPLFTAAIVFVFAIFILLQREDLRDRLIRLFGSGDLHRTTVAMDDAARRLSRYFFTQLAVNTGFGVVIGFGLFVIGVPSPLLWGLLATLLRFVPYIGSPLAAVLPLVLAAAVSPGWSMVLWTAALYVVVELVTGNAIEPMLYGHSTGLSPLSVIVVATFWAWLWGPIGLILSTPLTLCLVVLGRHVKQLEFLDVLLGDRPALTPIESFYQRMLTGETDEAVEQAELLLQDRALSSYYDEVALKGLRLAANDSLRSVLTQVQLERIRATIGALIRDLDDADDADPHPPGGKDAPITPPRAEMALPKRPAPEGTASPPAQRPPGWRSEAPILCVSGRGPLDMAASEMLAQLLDKHGLGACVVDHEAVSRTAIRHLDVSGVAMVCISYLELTGSPSHLRYLMRRLRLYLPTQKLLIGLWSSGEVVLHDERQRAAVGADYYTSSLREAVEACLDVLHQAEIAAGSGSQPVERTAGEDTATERIDSISAKAPPDDPVAAYR